MNRLERLKNIIIYTNASSCEVEKNTYIIWLKRMTKQMFYNDYRNANITQNWCSDVQSIMTKLDLLYHFTNKTHLA